MKKGILFGLLIMPLFLQGTIYRLTIDGAIDTITEEYVRHSFEKVAKDADCKLVIIEMDTPGGMVTSMRAIIKDMLNSPVPVVVYIYPRGARAGSAGFFITMAADVAAMTPSTNMGAAHPVSVTGSDIEGTMRQKVTNDLVAYIKTLAKNHNRNVELAESAVVNSSSYTAEECLQKKLCEYIANDTLDLIKQIDRKTVRRIDGQEILLDLGREAVTPLEMSNRQKFLKTITNPNLALFLLLIGLVGLYIEFTHPGVIIPGVLGGICLLLAFLAFQVLPINYVGLGLILLAVGLFVAEIKVQGFGILGIGGIVSFLLGSLMLVKAPIPEMRPAMSVAIALSLCLGGIILFLTYKVVQSAKKKPVGGREGLLQEKGIAKTEISSSGGRVFVHGEWWNAISESPIPQGSIVKIVAVKGMVLLVKKEGG